MMELGDLWLFDVYGQFIQRLCGDLTASDALSSIVCKCRYQYYCYC